MPMPSRVRPFLAVLAFLLVSLAVTPLAAQPVAGAARAVWLATSGGVVGISVLDASVLLEIAEPAGVHAVATDERRGVVWGYVPGALRGWRWDGTVAADVPAPAAGSGPVGLAVEPATGATWLAVGSALERRDPAGVVLVSVALPADLRALAFAAPQGRLWIGTASSLQAHDTTGQVTLALATGGEPVDQLAFDPATGQLWGAMRTHVRRWDGAGQLLGSWPLPGFLRGTPKFAVPDGAGGAWLALPGALARVSGQGQPLAARVPWPGAAITGLAADPVDHSVWVGSAPSVQHVGPTGALLETVPLWAGQTLRALALAEDRTPPSLAWATPTDGAAVPTGTPALEITWADLGAGVDPDTLAIQLDGTPLAATCELPTATGVTCAPGSLLADGAHTLAATIADRAGNGSASATVSFTIDTVAPVVTLTAPPDGLVTNEPQQVVAGTVSEVATLVVRVNGTGAATPAVGADRTFTTAPLTVAEGTNLIEVIAVDAAGHAGTATRTVTVDTAVPAPPASGSITVSAPEDGAVTVTGVAGSVEAGTRVTVTNLRTLVSVTVVAAADGSFVATLEAETGDPLVVVVTDAAGNASDPADATVPTGLPPDPATVVPPLDPTVATDLASATAFLYTGANPIQAGVAPGTIEPRRAAVIHGRALTREGAPFGGVTIQVLGHPAFGQTLSRADGMFDLAVNGGGSLTVDYQHREALPAQRTVTVPWQDFVVVDDVRLVTLDPAATVLTAGAAEVQVHQATPVTDADGTRRATVLVPAGTTATMVLPDGTTQPLTTLTVRATEYTVGAGGPAAMPAELPPASGYTYAVEFSVDEARAAGAARVIFDAPLISYTENFLGFPVGWVVPAGYYDRAQAAWVPADNGRVIKVLTIDGDLAELDLDGSGTAASAEALTALGITEAERRQLAARYAVGQTLWRVSIPHFSLWDFNWPFGPPADAVANTLPLVPERPEDQPTCQRRSIIECENEILGEVLGLTGTPFALHYRSDRVSGWRAAYQLRVPLSGPAVPASLRRIDLIVRVAGRELRQSFPTAPNQTATVPWDGRDVYGRVRQGAQPASVHVGYVYPVVYIDGGSTGVARAFGRVSTASARITSTRSEIILWQYQATVLGGWDARGQQLGGWTLGVHHTYDPVAQVLYLGDGRRRSGDDVRRIITTAAGTGVAGSSGDGGPAVAARLSFPQALAIGPDGSIYVAEASCRLRRIAADGHISTFAGTGSCGDGQDGIPATQTRLRAPQGVAVGQDGSVYVADDHRIRRITPDGLIHSVAGQLASGFSGDGGPATLARLNIVHGVAVAPDGTLYIADRGNHRIRQVTPDGIIQTAAAVANPIGLSLARDGSLYIASENPIFRVHRLGTDGRLAVVAGTGSFSDAGDGFPATQARLASPWDVALAPEGDFYIADRGGAVNTVRHVGTDGIIRTVAGITNTVGSSGDGGPASAALLNQPVGVAVAPDGTLYIADHNNHRVRRVAPLLPGFGGTEIVIAAREGHEVYVFDGQGRHLRTEDVRTHTVLYQFTYDDAGRLTALADRDGLITQIERDPSGRATAMVAPGGQRTTLVVDAADHLARLTNPAGETYDFVQDSDGLLRSLTTPRQHTSSFTYDPLGRLTHDADPAGGSATLARTDTATSHTVTLTTGEGRVSTYRVERLAAGGTRRTVTEPSGVQTVLVRGTNGRQTVTAPDGTVTQMIEGPDPRFRMQAPITTSFTVRTPSGLTRAMTGTRTVTLADPLDPWSLVSQTDTMTLNGRTTTSIFEATTKRVTTTSPAGRQTVATLDALGRVVNIERPGLEPVGLTYDTRGRLSTVTEGTGPAARVTTYGYDALDRLISLQDPLTRVTGLDYDLADRVTVQTRPDTEVIGFGYDANGNVTAVTPPARPTHSFSYTPVDLEASYTPPALADVPTPTISYTYNTDTQPTLVTRPDGQTVSFGYDSGGRLQTITQPRGTTTLGYHSTTGRLTGLTAPDGGTLAYTYDGSLLRSVTWGSGAVTGSVSWTYDSDFRLATEAVDGAQSVTYTYDPDSLVTGAGALSLTRDPQTGFLTGTTLGAVTDSRTYTTFGELDTYAAQVTGTPVLEAAYVRDALGRITEKIETNHEQVKKGSGVPDLSRQEAEELAEEWRRLGKPTGEGHRDPRGRGRRGRGPRLRGALPAIGAACGLMEGIDTWRRAKEHGFTLEEQVRQDLLREGPIIWDPLLGPVPNPTQPNPFYPRPAPMS